MHSTKAEKRQVFFSNTSVLTASHLGKLNAFTPSRKSFIGLILSLFVTRLVGALVPLRHRSDASTSTLLSGLACNLQSKLQQITQQRLWELACTSTKTRPWCMQSPPPAAGTLCTIDSSSLGTHRHLGHKQTIWRSRGVSLQTTTQWLHSSRVWTFVVGAELAVQYWHR